MGTHLSDEQIANFEKDGVMLLKGVIGGNWLGTLHRMVEKDVAEPGPHMERLGAGGAVFDDYNMWQHLDDARAWETTGPYPEIAAQLMRSQQVNLFMDQLIIKYPGATETTPWHQDTTYMGVDGRNFLTFWTTTRAISKELTVEYVRGSHNWGTVFAPFVDGPITVGEIPSYAFRQEAIKLKDGSTRKGTSDLPIPDIEGNRDDYDIVSFDVEPGDAIVFFANICHKGQGNAADATEPRVSVIARYCGDDATYAIRTPAAEFPVNPPANPVHGTPLRDYAESFPKVWPAAAA
jgi:ectoine hydroxylase-related dioxygenase (phytanoyl-CoA dioxygenase family)